MRLAIALLALLLLSLTPALPQAGNGSVHGVVRDSTDSPIPACSLTLTNVDTGIAAKTASNEAGAYLFANVRPGNYRLRAESAGMQAFEATLTVQVAQEAAIDVKLQVGQVSTQVEVVDVTPLVNASPALGGTLERTRIEELPINGREIQKLMETVPGMEGERGEGNRLGSQEYTQDGSPLSDRSYLGRLLKPPGLDTVQEFKVETNNSSAKYSRPISVIMSTRSGTNQFHGSLFETHRNNAIGKARQRQDLYTKAPHSIRNEFGASAGGPLTIPKLYRGRNRTFVFVAYEGSRNVTATTGNNRVPTEAMRNGDFSGLIDNLGRRIVLYDPWSTGPGPRYTRQPLAYGGKYNNIDPKLLNPIAKYLWDITPLPMTSTNPLLEDNWFGPAPTNWVQDTLTARLDHRFSDKDNMYVRLTSGGYDQKNLVQAGHLPTLGEYNYQHNIAPTKSLAASWIRTVSPTLFNEALLSVTRTTWRAQTGETPAYHADEMGLPNPFHVAGWPNFMSSPALTGTFYREMNRRHTAFTYGVFDDNATKVKGRHELQFGFHFRYDQLNELALQQNTSGSHDWNTFATSLYDAASAPSNPQTVPQTGHTIANMYLGIMNYSLAMSRNYFYARAREYAGYFQDNWKVAPRLTLNLGLRYEYWPTMSEKNNMMTGFDPTKRAIVLGTDLDTMYRLGSTTPSVVNRLQSLGARFISYKDAGMPESLAYDTKRDFGPRIGFAWRATPGSRPFVLRGGYRISYFPIGLQAWTWKMYLNAPFAATFTNSLTDGTTSPDGLPRWALRSVPSLIGGVNSSNAISLARADSLTRGSPYIIYFAKDQPDPRVMDWNLTLEKEFMANTIARFSYVGNHGDHLEQYWSFNDSPTAYVWYMRTGQRTPTGEFANVGMRTYDQQVYGPIQEYRKTGFSNNNGMRFEIQRRYSKGIAFQAFYVMTNSFNVWGRSNSNAFSFEAWEPEVFLPGAVPTDYNQLNRLINYQRDATLPKHSLRWNWLIELPVARRNRILGGWQLAGMGRLRSTYVALPEKVNPTVRGIEQFGYKYKIQDCRSGTCIPGYLWYNSWLPANRVNSYDASGKPNGIMGVPTDYKPSWEPLVTDPASQYYGTNSTVVTLKDGSQVRTTYDPNLWPWRQQLLPGPRQWTTDASLFKVFRIGERAFVRLNVDFFNVFNVAGTAASMTADGIVQVRNSGNAAREMQLTLRVTW
jgi:hypothetical protein